MLASDLVANKIKLHLERKQIKYPLEYYLNTVIPMGGKPFVENLIKYGFGQSGILNMTLGTNV
jgi:hypothetical protein